jgi:eukaryotic-like serine/threonine-protein kinase
VQSLAPGTRLGPYEVGTQIGAGGMGEVYRATDTNLKRAVAIKVLPTSVASDPDRLARFQREAEVLASLNHPHIAAIHGLERAAGITALVMELIEGPTLADRIGKGAIPVDEAVAIATQIADALAAAHDRGIVHRDLKPANVKVRADGTVKVLDFGLAKAMEPATGPSGSASTMPTITTPAMTHAGVILGTAAYMSPEQARGRPVDARTDVWAFGATLYEMLTGRRAFGGDDVADTLANVLKSEPDWRALPDGFGAVRTAYLKRCLHKDPGQRIRHVADVRLALQGAFDVPVADGGRTAASRTRLAWATAGAALLVAAGLAIPATRYVTDAPVDRTRMHVSLALDEGAAPAFIALSPDGRWLATSSFTELQLRSIESGELRSFPGTVNARTPFWSSDSRSVAFFSEGRLKVVPISGGRPEVLCEGAGAGFGGTWNVAGTILFATETGALVRVSPGGECQELPTTPGMARGMPVFLPDGDHFLNVVITKDDKRRGLYVSSLSGSDERRLLTDRTSAEFVAESIGSSRGRLLFVREEKLLAQPFDSRSLELSGDPVVIAEDVSFSATQPQIAATVAQNGALIYMANSRPSRRLAWFDRSGNELEQVAVLSSSPAAVSLAPDGQRVVFRRQLEIGQSLFIRDLGRNQETRMAMPSLLPIAPVWSPDGQMVAFGSFTDTGWGLFIKPADGATEQQVQESSHIQSVSDWTQDNRWLVYTESNPQTGADIWVLPDPLSRQAGRKPVPLMTTPAGESQGKISPDGQWIAFTSREAERHVNLRPFRVPMTAGALWQVSTENGFEPQWRADGKELFYLERVTRTRYKLMAVSIGGDPNPAGSPQALFDIRTTGTVEQSNAYVYAPARDGQRFLIDVTAKNAEPSLELVLNWTGAR